MDFWWRPGPELSRAESLLASPGDFPPALAFKAEATFEHRERKSALLGRFLWLGLFYSNRCDRLTGRRRPNQGTSRLDAQDSGHRLWD